MDKFFETLSEIFEFLQVLGILFVGLFIVVGLPWCCYDLHKQDKETTRQNADPSFCKPSKQIINPEHDSGDLNFSKWCKNVAHKGSIEGVVVTCSCPKKEE